MPYGVPNEKPEQTKWIEKCVESVMNNNPDYDESRAIAICKAQLKENNWKVPKSEESEREIITKVPDLKKSQHRRITWGPRTI